MHKFLSIQLITYQIFFIETKTQYAFNRGFLSNVGFLESLKIFDFDCFVIHDELTLPVNYGNKYECNKKIPRKLVSHVDNIGNGNLYVFKLLILIIIIIFLILYHIFLLSNAVMLYTKNQFLNMNGYIIDFYNDAVYLE